MSAHTMQCFHLAKETSHQIDKIGRKFFWKKKSNDSKSLPMVAWIKLCHSKKTGPLGLRKTEAVNSAF